MSAPFACLLIAALPSLGLAHAADDAKDKLAPLQGGWKFESLEVDGEAVPLTDTSFWWYIKGDKVLYGGSELATLTVDPGTSPKCMDLTFKEPKRILEGIYVIQDETLKICVNQAADGVKERPGEFSTKGKTGHRLLIFNRDKDRKADSTEGLAGYIGVQIKVDDDSKQVVVSDTVPGGPAAKAGLKKDDVVLKIGDQYATDLKSVVNMIRKVKPGSELTLRIRRDGKEKDITLKATVVPFFPLDS
jgi:uncharacterized protein (TIGR03067 family)